MPKQYCACKFRSTDTRSFTYHYDGEEPIAVGDMVWVPDARSDGRKRVEVVSISDEEQSFPTKPILGKLDPDAELAAEPAPTGGDDPLNAEITF